MGAVAPAGTWQGQGQRQKVVARCMRVHVLRVCPGVCSCVRFGIYFLLNCSACLVLEKGISTACTFYIEVYISLFQLGDERYLAMNSSFEMD